VRPASGIVYLLAFAFLVGAVTSRLLADESEREDVYVIRSRPSSGNLPVTAFCDAAQFPATHPVEREREFEYFSVDSETSTGKVRNASVAKIGGHRACYSRTVDDKLYTYGKGTIAGIPFTFSGTCMFTSNRAPQQGAMPYSCDYTHRDMPGYIGGQSLWNGIGGVQDSYLTTTIATIRFWKRPPQR
jgi:hypothetical protein